MKFLDKLLANVNIEKMIKTLPRKVAVLAVNFSKERFRDQAWMDNTPKKWKPRKHSAGRKSDNRAILVKSGRLRRSIRAISVSDRQVIIGSDVPYAQAHNEGGVWDVTQNIRSHTRKEHKRKGYTDKNGRKVSAGKVKQHTVTAFTRKRKIILPKRQFMGVSEALNKRIGRMIKREFDEVMRG